MKIRVSRVAVLSVISALSILLWSNATSAQDCGLLVKGGIYDYSSTNVDIRQLDYFIDWFRSQNFSSLQDAKQRSLTTGVVIDDVPISNAYGDSEDSFKQFKNDIESYRAGTHLLEAKLKSTLKTINTRVIDHLGRCLSQHGLHAWLETTSDPRVFRLTLSGSASSSSIFPNMRMTDLESQSKE